MASSERVIRGTTTIVGILGWPVSHALSPPMQNAAFAALDLDWAYVALPTRPERLAEGVRGLVALGFAGANVTIPHKQAVLELCDEVDEIAARAGSVNTLVFREGCVLGSSTDGEAITERIRGEGKAALVLGAGGSAQAAVEALERAGADVMVAARREPGWPPDAAPFDILVNATPVKEELIAAPRAGQHVVDFAYISDGRPTALVAAARGLGCDVVDGIDVLVAQGAASFERWTGRPAPVAAMRAAVQHGRQ